MASAQYVAYIHSEAWYLRTATARAYYKERCAVCRKDWRKRAGHLECHHLTYFVDGKSILGHETMADLRMLCEAHHKKGYYPLTEIQHDRKIYLTKKWSWLIITLPFRLPVMIAKGVLIVITGSDS